MSMLWRVLETIDYSVLRLLRRIPKPLSSAPPASAANSDSAVVRPEHDATDEPGYTHPHVEHE
jgi:hypothetical protein